MWKQRLKLEEGETLRLDSKYKKGNLEQEEVELYSVIDQHGIVVGSVQYTVHTDIKAPYRQSFYLVQGKDGITLVERWI